jgi:hypothetical protein
MTEKVFRYLTGFGNEHASEGVAGALPIGQNAPQRPPYGLYTEQISGTPFTAPRAENRRPWEMKNLWLDYIGELAREARANPSRGATTVVIGIHPFVIGTPDGAAAMRRVLSGSKQHDATWLADTEAILNAAAAH